MRTAPDTGFRRLLPLIGWTSGLLLVLGGTLALGGDPRLAAPPLRDPGRLAGWAAALEPVAAAFAVLRVVVLGLAAYLLVVTGLAVVLRVGGAGRAVRVADVVTLPWVRGVVHGALGLGLAGSAVASVAAVGGERAGGPIRWVTATDTAEPVASADVASTGTDHLVRLPDLEPRAPDLRQLGPAPTAEAPPATEDAQPQPQPEPEPEPEPEAAEAGEAAAPAMGGELTVGAGDHLWALAEQALGAAWGAQPDEAEVHAYWQALVEANRDRLADPANPDLVFPGQVLVLVAPPAAG